MTEVTGIDHIYIAASDMSRSEIFYDRVLLATLGFCKNRFKLCGEPHIQYYNRHFGYVLRPSGIKAIPDALSPGLHHLCFRVDTPKDVVVVATRLRKAGIAATDAKRYPMYAPDYWATYFTDPDGIRLEVTNYRLEHRERHDN
jgi:catechol 2,3-dioxygenase-like lactoylglutathione lyase family enzyme